MTSSNVTGLPLMLVSLSFIELNLSYVSALTLINLEPFGMFKLTHVCLINLPPSTRGWRDGGMGKVY
jgi:hypothetical protein